MHEINGFLQSGGFFQNFGDFAWLYAWVVLSGFLVLIQPLFTLVIAPMFNTFTPLDDGELKARINEFAKKKTSKFK